MKEYLKTAQKCFIKYIKYNYRMVSAGVKILKCFQVLEGSKDIINTSFGFDQPAYLSFQNATNSQGKPKPKFSKSF